MISVFISNETIQVGIGGKSGKKVVLKSFITAPVEDGSILNGVITNEAALGRLINDVWTKHKLPRSKINLIIDSGGVSTKIVKVPNVKEDMIISVIKDNFSEFDDLDARVIDFSILNPKNEDGGITALACTADDELIQSYIELFKKQNIKLEKIDLTLNCLIRLAKGIKALKEKTYIIAVTDKNTISLTLFINGQYRFSNRSRFVSERNSDELMDELTRVLSSMVQFNKSEKSGFDITNVYCCGLTDTEEKMCPIVTISLGITTTVFPAYNEAAINVKTYAVAGETVHQLAPDDCIYTLGNLFC